MVNEINNEFYDIEMPLTDGSNQSFTDFKGKMLLLVNTASRCGFTNQYEGLQKLHETYKAKGFSVLGFPSNEFGFQEPGTDEQIAEFCSLNFGVNFPLFRKSEVNGENASQLYQYLKPRALNAEGKEDVRWNFTKFLVDGDGNVVKRYEPNITPQQISAELESVLQ